MDERYVTGLYTHSVALRELRDPIGAGGVARTRWWVLTAPHQRA